MTAAGTPRGLRLSTEARGMLPWCIALSVAAHVLLLTAAAPAAPHLGGPGPQARRSTPGAISVRLIPEERVPEIGASESSAWPVSAASDVQLASSGATNEAPAAAPAGEPAAPAPAPAPGPAQGADSQATAATRTAGEAVDGGFVPRPQLSIAPATKVPVAIPTPSGMADLGRRVGVLALFIDEQGQVRHIEAEQPALPEAMERAAREAFMAARFSPGQVDGHVVKSRIRVEVVFNEAPLLALASPGAASGLNTASSAPPAPPAPPASPASDHRSR